MVPRALLRRARSRGVLYRCGVSSEPSPDTRFRFVFLAIGFLCVGLGVLGAFLPLLPTTPFLLIALWAFSRSSRRFHHWLYTHPRFGPRLQAWNEHGVIPLRVKLTSLSAMSGSFVFMAFVLRVKWHVLAAAGLIMLIGATYVLSRPSRPPE